MRGGWFVRSWGKHGRVSFVRGEDGGGVVFVLGKSQVGNMRDARWDSFLPISCIVDREVIHHIRVPIPHTATRSAKTDGV